MQLQEKSRSELLSKSMTAKPTKSYNTTRFERRKLQHMKTSASIFNKLDMNSVFKADNLSLEIPVEGETDNYIVTVLFDGICKDLQRELKKNDYKLEFKVVYKSLIRAVRNQNIFIGCTCKDYKFRFQYLATKGKYNALQAQLVPAVQTNPDDDQGAGCKHILRVLDDLSWVMQLATALNNYILYMREHNEKLFNDIMFKAIYGMPYRTAIEKGIIGDNEDMGDNEDIEENEEDEESN